MVTPQLWTPPAPKLWTPELGIPTDEEIRDFTKLGRYVKVGRAVKMGRPGSNPLNIITSVPVLQWIRGDLNVSLNSGNVSGWLDQTSNHHDFAQGSATAQPLYTASDATLSNLPTVTGDGSNDTLLNSTMPNGNGNWMSGIVKTVSWTVSRVLWGANGSPECADIITLTSSPTLAMYCGTLPSRNPNSALAVNTWGRLEVHYAGTASYLKLIGTTVAGGFSPGTASSTGCALFSTLGVAFGNYALAERVVCSGKPTPTEITNLDAYYTARYGAGLV